MSAKRKHRTTFDFLSYLKGELRKEDRHSFERDLERDPFQQEAMEGLESLTPGQAEEDLLSLHASLQKRLTRRKRRAWYSVAATVASILVVGTVFINIYDFNPEAKEKSFYQEESMMTYKESPEQDEAGIAEIDSEDAIAEESASEPEDVEIQEPVRESAAKKAVRSEKVEEVLAVEEEVLPAKGAQVPDSDREMAAAPLAPEAKAMDEKPMQAEANEPDEPDAMVVMEAAPEGRQKRAEKRRAREAAPQISQYKAAEVNEAVPMLTGRVSGVVISAEDMDPLPGASLYVKGTDSGMVTDMQGRFTIPVSEKHQATVVASYVGMVTEEYQLASGEENRLVMQPDMAALNEVVVVGYGVQKEANPTGALQRVQVAEKNDYTVYTGAEPVGGIPAYKMYMEKNIRFPAGDTLSKRAAVVLKFTVEKDGSRSGIQILRSPGDDFSKEAIRLVEEGPHWNPARDENGTTDDEVRMRIVFKK
jgi:hypothetical protein